MGGGGSVHGNTFLFVNLLSHDILMWFWFRKCCLGNCINTRTWSIHCFGFLSLHEALTWGLYMVQLLFREMTVLCFHRALLLSSHLEQSFAFTYIVFNTATCGRTWPSQALVSLHANFRGYVDNIVLHTFCCCFFFGCFNLKQMPYSTFKNLVPFSCSVCFH